MNRPAKKFLTKEVARRKALQETFDLINSGNAGLDKELNVVDIRLFPTAVPIPVK